MHPFQSRNDDSKDVGELKRANREQARAIDTLREQHQAALSKLKSENEVCEFLRHPLSIRACLLLGIIVSLMLGATGWWTQLVSLVLRRCAATTPRYSTIATTAVRVLRSAL